MCHILRCYWLLVFGRFRRWERHQESVMTMISTCSFADAAVVASLSMVRGSAGASDKTMDGQFAVICRVDRNRQNTLRIGRVVQQRSRSINSWGSVSPAYLLDRKGTFRKNEQFNRFLPENCGLCSYQKYLSGQSVFAFATPKRPNSHLLHFRVRQIDDSTGLCRKRAPQFGQRQHASENYRPW